MNWRARKIAEAREYAASQRGVIRCYFCGRQVWRGSFGAGRVALERHREHCRAEVAA